MEAFIVVLLLAVLGMTTAVPPLLDLSHTYNLDPQASHRVKILEKGMNRIYIGIELNQICSTQNTGTHLEAPVTFKNYGLSVDEIPFERLWRVPGVLLDVSSDAYHRDFQLTAEFLETWEYNSGLSIPDGGILLIRTDFRPEGKLSEDDDGHDTSPPQPRLTEDAAMWLVDYSSRHGHAKGIFGVGIDLNSLDMNDQNSSTSARERLYENDIYALHNLKNMERLPRSGFLVTVMPMKILKGKAAPARVMAEREDTRILNETRVNHRDDHSDWHSESDIKYPYPDWGYGKGDVMMSSGAAYRSPHIALIVALPLLVALRG